MHRKSVSWRTGMLALVGALLVAPGAAQEKFPSKPIEIIVPTAAGGGTDIAFRMLADTNKGPFQPAWDWVGLTNFAWAANAWTARAFIIVGDSWQWIPFIFIVMLAALESIPRDHVEAAQVDGAGSWQIFREITWPQIVPVAATVMLIRAIEAFKIVDLPNIMTGGGPGIATESMSLHSFFAWRANDYGQSAAVAYLLLFVTVVTCASFFNYVVLGQLRKVA